MSAADPLPSFTSSSLTAYATALAVVAAEGRPSFGTVSTTASSEADDDSNAMPWEVEEHWVPRQKSGKQKTPNMIRNELQRYIDECKANGTSTQTAIVETMGVNNNSFRRFMNPKTYKDQWSAVENGTYWAAARLLERVKIEKERAKKASKKSGNSGKRKASDALGVASATASATTSTSATSNKRSKAEKSRQANDFMVQVNAVQGVSHENGVYDTCPQVVTKIKAFLQRDGVTKTDFAAIGLEGVNVGSLNRFLSSKNQDQSGNITYKKAYEFFERLRILEGEPKSQTRLNNEAEKSSGFSTRPPPQWFVIGLPGM
jgi:hypothetical protein